MRPLNHLAAAGGMYPNAWKQIDIFRAGRGQDLPDWPSWCFLPMAAWYAIVSEGGKMPLERVPDVGRLAALGTWRYTQGIYRFDTDVYAALTDTIPNGEMPVEVLLRLPEWCVYIETPGHSWLGQPLHGFWAHLEFDISSKRPELRLLLDTDDQLIPMPLHMGPWTVTEAVDRAMSEADRQAFKALGVKLPPAPSDQIAAQLYGLVSLVLYLCSEEPELDDERAPGTSPSRPTPTKTKKGWRLFPATKPRIWTVAAKLGGQLRKNPIAGDGDGDGGDRKVSPHIRQAHWHGYWLGKKDGERRFKYKWLPPTLVSSD